MSGNPLRCRSSRTARAPPASITSWIERSNWFGIPAGWKSPMRTKDAPLAARSIAGFQRLVSEVGLADVHTPHSRIRALLALRIRLYRSTIWVGDAPDRVKPALSGAAIFSSCARQPMSASHNMNPARRYSIAIITSSAPRRQSPFTEDAGAQEGISRIERSRTGAPKPSAAPL